MADLAKLITAIASIVSAVVWPTLVAAMFVVFRTQIGAILDQLPSFLKRTEKAKLGWLELELKKQAEKAAETSEADSGTISPEQIRSAASVESLAKHLSQGDLASQVERLCIEYEMVRSLLPSGKNRTKVMNEIMAQMRTIGPSVAFLLDDFKSSPSAGKRLAAVAMMQMEPSKADLPWLSGRFGSESPFIFYHAALVLEALARSSSGSKLEEVINVAKHGISRVQSFDGQPDNNTIEVLNAVVHGNIAH